MFMTCIRRPIVSFTAAALLVAALAAPASAQTGQKLLTDISYALAPNLGQANNGPLADQNIFRQRLLRNFLGDGYGYEFTRTFGNDSYGNPSQVQIPGLTASYQGAIHNRYLINRRFIPQLRIQSDTQNAPLQYNITSSPGAESWTFQGSLTANTTGTVDLLGNYSLQVAATNTGTARLDGVAITDKRPTDFDVGPVNINGNIYVDLASNLLQAASAPLVGGANPAAVANNIPSAATGKDKTSEAADPSATLTDAQIKDALTKALVQSVFAQALSDLNPLDPSNGGGLLGMLTDRTIAQYDSSKVNGAAAIPEPGTIALLATPMLLMALRRRR